MTGKPPARGGPELYDREMTQEGGHAPLLCHLHLQKIPRLYFAFAENPFGHYQIVYFLIVPSEEEIDSGVYKI